MGRKEVENLFIVEFVVVGGDVDGGAGFAPLEEGGEDLVEGAADDAYGFEG